MHIIYTAKSISVQSFHMKNIWNNDKQNNTVCPEILYSPLSMTDKKNGITRQSQNA